MYLAAILEGDRRRAASIIIDAAQGKGGAPAMPVRDLYLEVLLPAQVELGRMWHLNEATVAEEHFATATTVMVISQLFPMLPFAPRNGLVAVAASVEGNAHDVGIRVLADLLESEGWRVVYLGASVPGDDLAQAVDMFGADLLALSAGLGCQLPTLAGTVERVRSASVRGRSVKILVGGGGFAGTPEAEIAPLWRSFGADGYAAGIDDGLRAAGALCLR
jgi:methanogenic corrinoid protein MtbC1